MVAAQNFANCDWKQVSPVWILIWSPAAKLLHDSAPVQGKGAQSQGNNAQAQENNA